MSHQTGNVLRSCHGHVVEADPGASSQKEQKEKPHAEGPLETPAVTRTWEELIAEGPREDEQIKSDDGKPDAKDELMDIKARTMFRVSIHTHHLPTQCTHVKRPYVTACAKGGTDQRVFAHV